MKAAGTAKAMTIEISQELKTLQTPDSNRFKLFWLLSPFWLAGALFALEHLSPAANAAIQFITKSPLQ